MKNTAIVDAGPFIALFDKSDSYHPAALRFFEKYRGSLLSNIAVITETCHLLGFHHEAKISFLEWIKRGAVTVAEVEAQDFERVTQLMNQYADLPIDFTDASLVALCERLHIKKVISIDRDFSIYRFRGKNPFQNHFFADE